MFINCLSVAIRLLASGSKLYQGNWYLIYDHFQKWAMPSLSFVYFWSFSKKRYNFYNNIMWKMSIQYPAQGFEPMTSWTRVSSHNHYTRTDTFFVYSLILCCLAPVCDRFGYILAWSIETDKSHDNYWHLIGVFFFI